MCISMMLTDLISYGIIRISRFREIIYVFQLLDDLRWIVCVIFKIEWRWNFLKQDGKDSKRISGHMRHYQMFGL